MNKLQEQATKQAIELLREYGIQDIPIDVHWLAEKLNVQIKPEALDDDTSGVLVIKNNLAVIGVNKFHHNRRQRFTIAHELGHFILHGKNSNIFIDKKYFTFYRDQDSAGGKDEQEITANAFAAELLMPQHILENYVDEQGIDL